jgi:hypothetical protein
LGIAVIKHSPDSFLIALRAFRENASWEKKINAFQGKKLLSRQVSTSL